MSAIPTTEMTEEAKQELVCTYAALILHDESLDISQDNLSKLITASGNSVEAYVPMLFSRALQGKDIGQLLTASGSVGGGGGGAPAAAAGDAAPAKKEEKEEEVEEEEEDDLGFSLFD
eukprot:GHVS01103535.1.p1 GENE.GHVS01103535.1~~GHVS01103535.1.p1  ORF type:complete len:118 (+),score=44.95 GHVS01103535.1:109-462(+)